MSAIKELNKKNLKDFDDVEICIKQVELNWPIHAEIVESAARIYSDLRTRITELEKAVDEMVVFIKYTEAVLACDGEYPSIRSEANELLKKYGGKE